jgi:Cdc6-like AAA superfamily ATPase
MITQIEKLEIQARLQQYCQQKGSQNKAANSLNGVSSATISKLLNNEWELINEVMWRNIAAQIGIKQKTWFIVETRDFKLLNKIFTEAQQESAVMAVCGGAGNGKSKIAEQYEQSNKNVFLLRCNDYWNRKLFLQELSRVMGISSNGDTVGDMMNNIVYELKKKENPLIIIDEADKLCDQVMYFFITLYNELEEHCGVVLMATHYLEKMVKKGLRLNRKGYEEINSRIGGKFISLQGVNAGDITEVCIANGIENKAVIKDIISDSNYDLRRVKRKVTAYKKSRITE